MKIRLFSVFLVGFATAFNTFAIHAFGRPLSAGLIAVALYFISLTSLPLSSNLRIVNNRCRGVIWLPIIYIFLLTIVNFFFSDSGRGIFPMTLFLDWLLFIALLAHSVSDEKAIDVAFYGFSFGAIILSVLFFIGIGVETNITRDGARLSMFGSNENVLGIIQSFSTCIILNLFIFEDRLKLKIFKWFFLVCLFLSFTMVVATGSRTALLIVVCIYICSLLAYRSSNKFKKILVLLSGIAIMLYAYKMFIASDSTMLTRVLASLEDGSTGGRTDIWKAYLNYFPENPIFGVGTSGLLDVAIKSGVGTTFITGTETAFSPHNVFIEVLMTTGVVGLIIMTVFWWRTFHLAYVGLKQNKLNTPLMLAIIIIVVLMSGQLLGEKYAWMAYSYMIVSSWNCNIYDK